MTALVFQKRRLTARPLFASAQRGLMHDSAWSAVVREDTGIMDTPAFAKVGGDRRGCRDIHGETCRQSLAAKVGSGIVLVHMLSCRGRVEIEFTAIRPNGLQNCFCLVCATFFGWHTLARMNSLFDGEG